MINVINTAILFAILIFIAFDLKITIEYVSNDERNEKVHAILEDIFGE